jgi:hypothetical protein
VEFRVKNRFLALVIASLTLTISGGLVTGCKPPERKVDEAKFTDEQKILNENRKKENQQ